MTAEPSLFTGADWDFDKVQRAYDAIEAVARDELGLDPYPVRLEVITAEQMLDAYAATGLPVMYPHWSFGKRFAQHESLYRHGLQSLALEIVINSDPSLCYIMEENTMATQATVIAHAAMGHAHFFKNNQVFRDWTDADTVLAEMREARDFVMDCENRYGRAAVERLIDAAHALFNHGVDRDPRTSRPDPRTMRERLRERRREERESLDDLWRRTVPTGEGEDGDDVDPREAERRALGLPEENLLYFLEANAPMLEEWQRGILRIVRRLASYLEPQRQTKMMNEGCATWSHYEIMTRLRDRGQLDEGTWLEFLHLHSQVIAQPDFDQRGFGGINPYALGFSMMTDIARICIEPTDEDRAWFPDIAGNGEPHGTLRRAWSEFRDESFIRQFLSPRQIREWRLFSLHDAADAPAYRVEAIHDEDGYRAIRSALADSYDPAADRPRIEVVDADLRGSRRLDLVHKVQDGHQLDPVEARRVLRHLRDLWSYDVRLREIDADTAKELSSYTE